MVLGSSTVLAPGCRGRTKFSVGRCHSCVSENFVGGVSSLVNSPTRSSGSGRHLINSCCVISFGNSNIISDGSSTPMNCDDDPRGACGTAINFR